MSYPKVIAQLIDDLTKLPGVGKRTATRYVFHLLYQSDGYIQDLTTHLHELKQQVKTCSKCHTISMQDPCPICADQRRNVSQICIVSTIQNMQSIEETHSFKGTYHILGGTLNALEGITPDKLNIKSLIKRLKSKDVKEMILALNPDIAGESTALYLQRVVTQLGLDHIIVTKLARGLPMGADMDYADKVTLSNALQQRQDV